LYSKPIFYTIKRK